MGDALYMGWGNWGKPRWVVTFEMRLKRQVGRWVKKVRVSSRRNSTCKGPKTEPVKRPLRLESGGQRQSGIRRH